MVAVAVVGVWLTTVPEARSQARAWFVPAVSLGVSHDDNLFLAPDGPADTFTHIRPSVEGAYESPTREVRGFAAFDAQVSAQYPSLTALGARRNALIDARVRPTPFVAVGLGARYDRTDSPAELNLESGILLGRENATRTQVTPSVSYRRSPRTTATAQYDLTTESLAGAPGQSVHAARVGMDYAWSGRTQWGGRYLARSFVGSPLDPQYSHALLMAWTRQVAPNTNLSIQGGPRVRSYGGLTTEFLASFFRRKPRQRFLLDYWHGETIVLGVPGPVDVHSGSNRTSWLVRNNLEVTTVVGVFRSASLTDARALVYYGGVGGSWTLREFYTLTGIYSANYQLGDLRRQLPPDGRLRRGVVVVGVTIAPRLTRIFRPAGLYPAPPMTGVLRP